MARLRWLSTVSTLALLGLTLTACEPTANPQAPELPDDSSAGPPPDDGDPADDPDNPADPDDPGDPDDPDDPDDPVFENAYPRVAAFAGAWDQYTSSEHDSLARFDLICLRAPPDAIEYLRRLNPDIEIYYRVMPQLVAQRDWGLDWSWMDTVRRYADENDWIMQHHNGTEAIAKGWGTYWRWGDFTSRCPLGTRFDASEPELDSRGLTFAEWMATRFIPWFETHHMNGYDGFWWEVVAEEVNPYWWHTADPYSDGGYLDWNRNGTADRSESGEIERFAAEWDSVTTWWIDEVRTQVGSFPIIGGGDRYAPSIDHFDGFKNEDFLNRNRHAQPYWTWWNEFYATQSTRPRRGYVYQRDRQRGGWDRSVNQIFWSDSPHQGHSDPQRLRQFVRFALGTTLLGDGFFSYYDIINTTGGGQPANPWVSELYDLRLGSHGEPFDRVTVGADTLYVRDFHDGLGNVTGRVTVNPNSVDLDGVAAEDARIEVFTGSRAR